MRLSLLQNSNNREMRYNPFVNSHPIIELPTYALIETVGFDRKAQPIDIIQIFEDYQKINPLARNIGYYSDNSASINIPDAAINARWGETIDGVSYTHDIITGTAFTAGSTKRYIIHCGGNLPEEEFRLRMIPEGLVWLYLSKFITKTTDVSFSSTIKYVHLQDVSTFKLITNYAFTNCGILGILSLPKNITRIEGTYCFWGNRFEKCNMYPMIAPVVEDIGTAFGNAAIPLHIKHGAIGYDVDPWTNTSKFSSIIADL